MIKGKWWSELGRGVVGAKARNYGYISRIIETELGEKLEGDRIYTPYRELGQECWVYSKEGVKQVKYAGSTCTRYRVVTRSGGCSNSTRVTYYLNTLPPLPSLLLLRASGSSTIS